MDEGVLESMKRRYRASLVRDLLLSEDKDIVTFLKEINMLKVIEKIAISWDQISPQTIRRSWQKLINIVEDENPGQEDLPSNTEFVIHFQILGFELEEKDVQDWLYCHTNNGLGQKWTGWPSFGNQNWAALSIFGSQKWTTVAKSGIIIICLRQSTFACQ